MKTIYKFSVFLLAALIMPLAVPAEEGDSAPLPEGLAGAYLSGQFARASGDIAGAIRYLRRANHEHPENLEIATQLQGMLLLSGEVEAAMILAARMPESEEKNAVSDLLLCLKEVKKNDFERAGIILKQSFGGNGGQLWLPLIAAWLDAAQGKLAKPLALDDLNADTSRAAPLLNYHLALIHSYAGLTEAAAINFKQAIENPENPPAHVMDMLLAFYEENGRPEILAPIAAAGRRANPERDAVSMIATPKEGIAEVLFTMGSIMHGAGITQDAVIYLQLSRYLKPDFPWVAIALGDAYGDLKQHERANAAYASVTEGSRFYAKSRLRLAASYNQQGKSKEALKLLDRLIGKFPEMHDAYVAKGDLLRAGQDLSAAADAYSRAIVRLGEPQPQHWPVFFARGSCLERLGKWEAARRDMEQALALKPDQPDVLNYLGYSLLVRNQRIGEAKAMIEKAIRARPNDPQIIDSMGWALFSIGQYGEAAAYLEKAVELLPSDPTINHHLGDAYWRLGRKTEARYQWERALNFSPGPAEEQEIRNKLKDGFGASAKDQSLLPVIANGDPLR